MMFIHTPEYEVRSIVRAVTYCTRITTTNSSLIATGKLFVRLRASLACRLPMMPVGRTYMAVTTRGGPTTAHIQQSHTVNITEMYPCACWYFFRESIILKWVSNTASAYDVRPHAQHTHARTHGGNRKTADLSVGVCFCASGPLSLTQAKNEKTEGKRTPTRAHVGCGVW